MWHTVIAEFSPGPQTCGCGLLWPVACSSMSSNFSCTLNHEYAKCCLQKNITRRYFSFIIYTLVKVCSDHLWWNCFFVFLPYFYYLCYIINGVDWHCWFMHQTVRFWLIPTSHKLCLCRCVCHEVSVVCQTIKWNDCLSSVNTINDHSVQSCVCSK